MKEEKFKKSNLSVNLSMVKAVCKNVLKLTDTYDDLETAFNDAHAECFKVKAERDRLQKRVEALERAIKGLGNDGGCQSCIHDDDRPFGKPCYGCNYDLIRFEFDEARFSGGEQNG